MRERLGSLLGRGTLLNPPTSPATDSSFRRWIFLVTKDIELHHWKCNSVSPFSGLCFIWSYSFSYTLCFRTLTLETSSCLWFRELPPKTLPKHNLSSVQDQLQKQAKLEKEEMARMKLKELESHLQQVDEFESPKILLGESRNVEFINVFHDDHICRIWRFNLMI